MSGNCPVAEWPRVSREPPKKVEAASLAGLGLPLVDLDLSGHPRPDERPGQADAEDDTSPASSLPGAGRRVDEAEREAALAAEPAGTAEVGDTVDTDELDSRAHDGGDDPTG